MRHFWSTRLNDTGNNNLVISTLLLTEISNLALPWLWKIEKQKKKKEKKTKMTRVGWWWRYISMRHSGISNVLHDYEAHQPMAFEPSNAVLQYSLFSDCVQIWYQCHFWANWPDMTPTWPLNAVMYLHSGQVFFLSKFSKYRVFVGKLAFCGSKVIPTWPLNPEDLPLQNIWLHTDSLILVIYNSAMQYTKEMFS